MAQNISAYSALIKAEAKRLGFMFCGIAKAEFLEEEAPRLEAWLNAGMHGEMQYMENYFDKRLDPRLLVDGAKSVISLALNYYTDDNSLILWRLRFQNTPMVLITIWL
jgi:epoxyqueuosine reductase